MTRAMIVCAVGLGGWLAAEVAGSMLEETYIVEEEPNDDKARANRIPLWSHHAIVVVGWARKLDRDYYRCESSFATELWPDSLRLEMPWTGALRGIDQRMGSLVHGSDVVVQRSEEVGYHDELQWYGFGKGGEVYVDAGRLEESDGWDDAYDIYYQTHWYPVQAEHLAAALEPGPITITTVPAASGVDTDLWVYDARFNALPGYGNDDDPATGGPASTLTRRYAPGRYWIAITDRNLANDQPSPADDASRSKPALDFPDVVVGSSPATGVDLSFEVRDAGGAIAVPAHKRLPHEILWFSFDVGEGQAIRPFCEGSYGAGCPCGNWSEWQRGDGCRNSTGRGALLFASGSTEVAAGDLAFHCNGLPPRQLAVLAAASIRREAAAFGAGIFCLQAATLLRSAPVDAQGKANWDGLPSGGIWQAGTTRYVQVLYRDPVGPCAAGFNATNALAVSLAP